MIQNVYNTTEIFLEKPYSASVITYDLYGEYIQDEEQLNYLKNIIIGLNKEKPAHVLSGTIRIVEIG